MTGAAVRPRNGMNGNNGMQGPSKCKVMPDSKLS